MDNHLVENVICNLASQFMDGHNLGRTLTLPNAETEGQRWNHAVIGEYGILIPVEISCDNHGYDKKGKAHKDWEPVDSRRYLQFIILSSRKVFVSVSSKYIYGIATPETFENTSNHDTCWRSDGMRPVFKAFMDTYDDCWKHINDKLAPAPIAANHFTSFHDIKFVKVVHEPIDRRDTYFKKLVKIEQVDYSLSLKDRIPA